MKLAFISYEYPNETGGGGIGTFLYDQIPILAKELVRVVVFCGTKSSEAFWENELVYRIPCDNSRDFNLKALPYFTALNNEIQFDLIEGTDFLGWGLDIKKAFPKLQLIVRLHTPLYLIDLMQNKPLSLLQKFRFVLGALKRLQIPKLPGVPRPKDYEIEFEILKLANAVIAPTQSIREKLISLNMLNKDIPYQVIPFGFTPSDKVRNIKAKSDVSKRAKIVYIGRLEKRKGVLELAQAIPMVLEKFPHTIFIFVGAAAESPLVSLNMQAFLERKLEFYKDHIQFTGQIPRKTVEKYFDEGDIFVYPSQYESFGIACCEAMSAGKAVIGSLHGGMTEIIEDGVSGILVNNNPNSISTALIEILSDQALRLKLGIGARERILEKYALEKITQMNIDFYKRISNN